MSGRMSQRREERKKLPVWYRCLSAALTVCAVAAVLFCGLLALIARAGSEGGAFFGSVILRVETGSMSPTFEPGDIVLFSEYGGEELAAGDIIVFRAPSGPLEGERVTHRITGVAEDGSGFFTRGDASESDDAWTVSREDIEGVFARKLPLAGSIAGYMQSAGGRMLVIGLPIVLLVAVLLADAALSRRLASESADGAKHDGHADGEKS